jgi:hypothetical protein
MRLMTRSLARLAIFAATLLVLASCTEPTNPVSPVPVSIQPTSPPTATHSGNREELHCATSPNRCGYPDESNTGVTPGTVLRRSGPITVATDGQVVEDLDITGEINVTASNVVIKNTKITGGRGAGNKDWVVIMRPGASNLTIVDSEITTPAGSAQDIACVFNISDGAPTIERVNIHGCSAGISSGGGLIRDSYIHDLSQIHGLSHNVGIASNGGGGMTIEHNTVLNQFAQTSAVSFYQDFSTQKDNVVRDNLLGGGAYCIYGGAGDRGPTRDIQILNNRLSRRYFHACGSYGVLAAFKSDDPGNAFSGNYWDDTGQDVET